MHSAAIRAPSDRAPTPPDRKPSAGAPPLSLYVHLPWCVRKCPYCDFNSYEARGALPDSEYVRALLRDLAAERAYAARRPIETVFIGGGTPSLFSGSAIRRLMDGIRSHVDLAAGAEITLEANPGAVEAERFEAFRAAGVNRLSIGVQSFREAQLALLGRVHGAEEARNAVLLARRAGFDNVNVDLMYGLPDDDVAGALGDLRAALELEPAHVSWYQLTLEPRTAFHRKPPGLPREETVSEIEAAGRALLARRGYERYEVSAYATRGQRCRHNVNYWSFGDYLGIGAGAHGKITEPSRRRILRRAKVRNPRTYLEAAGTPSAAVEERVEAAEQIVLEFMMNALRLTDGVTLDSFEQRTGLAAAAIEAGRREAVRRGWMSPAPGVLRATQAGREMLNSLLLLL